MILFEYLVRVNNHKEKDLQVWLNKAGEEGWELVHVTPETRTFLVKNTYLFKRQIRALEAKSSHRKTKEVKEKSL